ncbi:MAG TPA: hypothetical protein VIL17_03060 [Coriobacteriia bacterium]
MRQLNGGGGTVKRAILIVTVTLLACAAVAAVLLSGGADGETWWSVGHALQGTFGATSAEAEAGRVEQALRTDDASALAALCPQPLSDLRSWVGTPFTSVRLVNVEAVSDADGADAYFEVASGGTTSSVVFYLQRGPSTGWRADGFDITP